jgi:hypothetical protein
MCERARAWTDNGLGTSRWVVWEYAPRRIVFRMTAHGAIGGQDQDVFEMRFVSVNVLCLLDACEQARCVLFAAALEGCQTETIGRGQIANEMYRVLKMLRIR